MATSPLPFDHGFAGFLDGPMGPVRAPRRPSDVLVDSAQRLLERANLPLRIRQDLHSLKRQTRRVAADRSGFALVMDASVFAAHPADALWFSRLIESEMYGRCALPTLAPEIAHESESHAGADFDIAQIRIRERKDQSSLDALLFKGLVQEVATRMVTASEANDMRVRSKLIAAGW